MEIRLRYRWNLAIFFFIDKLPTDLSTVVEKSVDSVECWFFKVLKERKYLGCEQVYPQVVGLIDSKFYKRY